MWKRPWTQIGLTFEIIDPTGFLQRILNLNISSYFLREFRDVSRPRIDFVIWIYWQCESCGSKNYYWNYYGHGLRKKSLRLKKTCKYFSSIIRAPNDCFRWLNCMFKNKNAELRSLKNYVVYSSCMRINAIYKYRRCANSCVCLQYNSRANDPAQQQFDWNISS